MRCLSFGLWGAGSWRQTTLARAHKEQGRKGSHCRCQIIGYYILDVGKELIRGKYRALTRVLWRRHLSHALLTRVGKGERTWLVLLDKLDPFPRSRSPRGRLDIIRVWAWWKQSFDGTGRGVEEVLQSRTKWCSFCPRRVFLRIQAAARIREPPRDTKAYGYGGQ